MKRYFAPGIVVAAALAFVFPASASGISVELDCAAAYIGSPEWEKAQSMSTSKKAIAKHAAIEKCVREMMAYLDGQKNNPEPDDCIPAPPADRKAYRHWLISELERLEQ